MGQIFHEHREVHVFGELQTTEGIVPKVTRELAAGSCRQILSRGLSPPCNKPSFLEIHFLASEE